MSSTLVEAEPARRCRSRADLASRLDTLEARLWESTVDGSRSTVTDPFVIALLLPRSLTARPMNTPDFLANVPPWFKPMACA